MQAIPAMDIIGGRCVRLISGDYAQITEYPESPLSLARKFEAAGFKRLHMVDLEGARTGKLCNLAVLEEIASNTNLIIDFGGGIKHRSDVEAIFKAGAKMISLGSLPVKDPEQFQNWLSIFGADHIILAADVANGHIAVSGWQHQSDLRVIPFLRRNIQHGVKHVMCTDISKDGKLSGPGIDLYREILSNFPDLNFIASGGISSMKDLENLAEIGIRQAIVGKAIYEKKISLEELSIYAV